MRMFLIGAALFVGTPALACPMADAAAFAEAAQKVEAAEGSKLSIAVAGMHCGSCCLNVNEIEEIQAAVRLADREADIVVLSFHGGAEGYSARNVPGRTEVAFDAAKVDQAKLLAAIASVGFEAKVSES
ncbi:MAG: hypothetical protein KC656_25655 [Myxococcales bacterium]|nr:hypothetical protein [Myxococcales bacterium]